MAKQVEMHDKNGSFVAETSESKLATHIRKRKHEDDSQSNGLGRSRPTQDTYLSRYCHILNENIGLANRSILALEMISFEPSQVGSVCWSSHEKLLLFQALGISSRENIGWINNFLRTKSELEIHQYLDFLKGQTNKLCQEPSEIEAVSFADMPAALEISEQCCELLEANIAQRVRLHLEDEDESREREIHGDFWRLTLRHAKYLRSRFQDGFQREIRPVLSPMNIGAHLHVKPEGVYEQVAGSPFDDNVLNQDNVRLEHQEMMEKPHLRPSTSSAEQKEESGRDDDGIEDEDEDENETEDANEDEVEEEDNDENENENYNEEDELEEDGDDAHLKAISQAATLLNLDNFLLLSNNVFMNHGTRAEENWRHIGEIFEMPSIFATAFNDFKNLAINYTQRLVQTSLFLSQSRQRAVSRSTRLVPATVTADDVLGATDMLGLQPKPPNFWNGSLRRYALRVYNSEKDKAEIPEPSELKAPIPYEDVDFILCGDREHPYPEALASSIPKQAGIFDVDSCQDSSGPETTVKMPHLSRQAASDSLARQSISIASTMSLFPGEDAIDTHASVCDATESAKEEAVLMEILRQVPFVPHPPTAPIDFQSTAPLEMEESPIEPAWRARVDYWPEWERNGRFIMNQPTRLRITQGRRRTYRGELYRYKKKV